MKSKKNISLKKQFKDAKSYLKESLSAILTISLIFLLSIFTGILFSNKLTIINELLKDIVNSTIDLNAIELILFILQNNLQTSFLGFVSGIFMAIPPIISTIVNGVILGYVISIVTQEIGLIEIWRLFPHGIFELPAVMIALGIGLKFPGFIFSKYKIKEFKRRFFNSINVFLFIILPLLIIAAIIEGLLINFL